MAKNKTGAITPENAAKEMLKHPEKIGVMVGFKDLTRLHGKWIREIVFGTKGHTIRFANITALTRKSSASGFL